MINSFVSKQLPYPYISFDMMHCTKCNIEWAKMVCVTLLVSCILALVD
jgi:hypothetical protein